MKTILKAAAAAGLLAVAACGGSGNDAAENKAENIMDAAENRAENITDAAENRAENIMDSAENRADAITDGNAAGNVAGNGM